MAGSNRKINSEARSFNMKPKPMKDCLFKSIAPTEGMVVNLADGEYYTLNEVGQSIWQAMDGQTSIGKIAERITKQYRGARRKIVPEVSRYINQLKRKGLVTLRAPEKTVTPSPLPLKGREVTKGDRSAIRPVPYLLV